MSGAAPQRWPAPLGAVARLVRAPAALTVPGDVLVGAAAARQLAGRHLIRTSLSSVCLYWAGMALNDYADRAEDARTRPERPIPAGEVPPAAALSIACGLTAAGLAVSPRRSSALPVAAAAWAYDLRLKAGPWGPVAMAAARSLDVLAGAGRSWPAGIREAAAVGGHTAMVSWVSRREADGGSRARPLAAMLTTAALAGALAARPPSNHSPTPRGRAQTWVVRGLALGYLASAAPAQARAVRRPTAAVTQAAVGRGMQALIPLQGALIARAGQPALGLAVAAIWPTARRLGRRVATS